MTTRAAELREAAALDAEQLDFRERTGTELWQYASRRQSFDRDYDAPRPKAEPAGFAPAPPPWDALDRLVNDPRWLCAAQQRVLDRLAAEHSLILSSPHRRPRAPACAHEGGRVEPDPSLASPRVEEPVSARSEFRGLGTSSA